MKLSELNQDEVNVVDQPKLSLSALGDKAKVVSAPSELESFGTGVVQGGTLGFSDELGGAKDAAWSAIKNLGDASVESIVSDYIKSRDERRAANELAQKANPKSYLAGELGGGIAPALIPGLGLSSAGRAAGALTQEASIALDLAKAAQAAKIGGIAGAGFSKAKVADSVPMAFEGNVDELRKNAGQLGKDVLMGAAVAPAVGAAAEMVVPPVADVAGRAITKPYRAVKDAFFKPFELGENAPEVIAAAKRLGIEEKDIPGWLLTDDPEAKRMADMVTRSGRVGGTFARQDMKPVTETLKSGTDDLLSEATGMTAGDVGRKVQQGVRKGTEEILEPVGQVYSELDSMFGDKPVSDASMRNVRKLVEEFKTSPGLGSDAKRIANEIGADLENVKTIDDLRKLRTNLDGLLPEQPSANQRRIVSELRESLTKARDNSLGRASQTTSIDIAKAPMQKDLVPDLEKTSGLTWRKLLENSEDGESITFSDPHVIISTRHPELPKNHARIIFGGGKSEDVPLNAIGSKLKELDPNGRLANEFNSRFGINDGSISSLREVPEKQLANLLNKDGFFQYGNMSVSANHADLPEGYVRVHNLKSGTYEDVRVTSLRNYLDNNGYKDIPQFAKNYPDVAMSGKVAPLPQTEIQRSVLEKALEDTRFNEGDKYRKKIGDFTFQKVSSYSQSPNAGKVKVDGPKGTMGYVDPKELPAWINANDPNFTVAKQLRNFKYKIPSTITKDPTATRLLKDADKVYGQAAEGVSNALPYNTKRKQGAMEPVRRLEDESPEQVRKALNLFQNPDRQKAFSGLFPEEAELLRRAELARIKGATTPPQGDAQRAPGRVLQEIFGAPRGEPRYQPEMQDVLLGKNAPMGRDLKTLNSALPADYNPSHTASAQTWLDAFTSPRESVASYLRYKQLKIRSPKLENAAPTSDSIIQKVMNNPSTKKYAALLQNAASKGPTSVAAINFLLSQTDPEYQKAVSEDGFGFE